MWEFRAAEIEYFATEYRIEKSVKVYKLDRCSAFHELVLNFFVIYIKM